MPAGEGLSEVGEASAVLGARINDMRQALTATRDETARSRLRVRLADLLAAVGDSSGALAELMQAAAEGTPSAGLLFGLRVVAPQLRQAEVDALRGAIESRRPRGAASGRPSTAGPAAGLADDVPLPSSSAASPPLPLPTPAPLLSLTPHPQASGRSPVRGNDEVPAEEEELIELAFAAISEGKMVRARRLGEEAARAGALSTARPGRLLELVLALERAGASRESLRLARSLAESDPASDGVRSPETREAVAAVIERAIQLGDDELADRWRVDLLRSGEAGGVRPPGRPERRSPPATPRAADLQRFQAAQRAVFLATSGAEQNDPAPAIAQLINVMGSQPRGAAAFALAARLSKRLGERTSGAPSPPASPLGSPSASTPTASLDADLLRRTFELERQPRRRVKLALRWAEVLDGAGNRTGAVAVLGRAIDDLPGALATPLRERRAALLRAAGRQAELARVLDADAMAASGEKRIELRLEQARLLEEMGELDRGLEVRLDALGEAPGQLGVLGPARQRLEGAGRLDRSLELAQAALPHVVDREARAGLLRDIATLAEAVAGDQSRAALAWLEVLVLSPEDTAAFEAAERLLRELEDHERLGALLAWWAARQENSSTIRDAALWRLAEFRRVERQEPLAALPIYREMAQRRSPDAPFKFNDEDWQRRDDLLAVHTARALAAPTVSDAVGAVGDRAVLLVSAGRLDEADLELGRALELDVNATEVIRALEGLYQQRGDVPGLRQRLMERVEAGPPSNASAALWLGIGRSSEALGDLDAARAAYERAASADATAPAPVAMLRQMAAAEGRWVDVARLLEAELGLCPRPVDRVPLLVELGALLATRLDAPERAVEVLDAALVFQPANPTALDAMFGAALATGLWERATQALEAMLAAGLALADTSQRYHRLGLAAEKAGQIDRALGFYSRSYARNPVFRPTLERLSEICFERQQWENAWKATEHLIERHGSDLDGERRAELALRSALAELHVAQRLVAANRVAAMLGGPASQGGVRDVADSWASIRFEPRLLAGLDGDRRKRVLSRLEEVLTLTSNIPGHAAREMAGETLTALAMVDRRWADALRSLDALGGDAALDARRRCSFQLAAGDILLHHQGDVAAAAVRYQRARVLNPHDARLARPEVIRAGGGAPGGTGGRDGGNAETSRDGTRFARSSSSDDANVQSPATPPRSKPSSS